MKEITKESIDRFVEHGLPPGDFLTNVLSNDLMGAFMYADEENKRDMEEILTYIYNDIPAACHGNPEKVNDWINRKMSERREMI